MGLRLLAQTFDLSERLLRLAGGVASERAAHLLGPRLRARHGVLEHARIRAHHVVEVFRLGVDRV